MQTSFTAGYRLTKLSAAANAKASKNYNWLFLPGGPGMGSEYLSDFAGKLNLPGNIYIADFPGDGSNRHGQEISYKSWRNGLLEVVCELQPCVLVTHSFSGMFALTIAELEDMLTGLVLISTAPDSNWLHVLRDTKRNYSLPDLTAAYSELFMVRTDQQLKQFFHLNIPYLFAAHEIEQGLEMFNNLPYNIETRLWAKNNFLSSYAHSWIPNKLPTLIIGSHDDRLLPINLFFTSPSWQRPHIKMLELHNTGHFPWLSQFDIIAKELHSFNQALQMQGSYCAQEVFNIINNLESKELTIFVDVDDTLITPSSKTFHHSPYKELIDEIKQNKDSYKNYAEIISNWRLQRKIMLLDEKWPGVLKNLQQNHLVYALTKMDIGQFGNIPSMELWRYRELSALGLTFTPHIPTAENNLGGACFHQGIFMTGTNSKSSTIAHYLPYLNKGHFILVDDRLEHLLDMQEFCLSAGIEFTGILYKGLANLTAKPNAQVANLQRQHLIAHAHWLEDEDAERMLNRL